MTLLDHLRSGTTTVCRCWSVERSDGVVLGFTDHDRDLSFEGIHFRAETGMTARAFQQSTGLSVDNSEAVGALSDDAISESDVDAGRYDGAIVTSWMVNWAHPGERSVQFVGTLGEITRTGRGFRAELRGLTESLNQPQGLVYQRQCSAVLGDRRCRVSLSEAAFSREITVEEVERRKLFVFRSLEDFDPRWFERGRLTVLSGEASALVGVIKNDRETADGRLIELWQALGAPLKAGDRVRVEAGCDKRAETCKAKFSNYLNFRGFPDIPGEDWLMAYPTDRAPNDGGSLT